MPHNLATPSGGLTSTGDELYLARGSEIDTVRPIFTGDVFAGIEVISPDTGTSKKKTVIVVKHPCALRSDGVNLTASVLVAEVRRHRPVEDWTGYGRLMPLPGLLPETSLNKHYAALFDELRIARATELSPERRVACMSQEGVNLLLQRWIHHTSRVVVPVYTLNEVIAGPYEEADLVEIWCLEAVKYGASVEGAAAECIAWLRQETAHGVTRQRQLENAQHRSRIRREVRQVLRERTVREWTAAG